MVHDNWLIRGEKSRSLEVKSGSAVGSPFIMSIF
jgi:hypothetical protein